MPTFSSPNRLVWQYFGALRRAVTRAETEENPDEQKLEIAVTIFLAITTIEIFLNLFFRILVEEDGYQQHRSRLLEDLSPPFLPLDKKWKLWPRDILGHAIVCEAGPGKRFLDLKDLRNQLMHFTSSHETLFLSSDIRIEGLPETSVLEDLTPNDARNALLVAEEAVGEILLARGILPEEIPRYLRFWTGIM